MASKKFRYFMQLTKDLAGADAARRDRPCTGSGQKAQSMVTD